MQVINITVRNRIAENPGHDRYICGNSDFIVRFDFDAEWESYETKTARFAYGRKFVDVVFTGNECPVPVIANVCVFEVGVFAGNLVTTTPATVPADLSILCSGGTPADPAPDVYHQIMERIQEIEDNGVTDEQLQDAVASYLEENPVDTGSAVRYDAPQELTEEQKAQARANIGIETYAGTYTVTPSTTDAVTLQTAQMLMENDVTVQKIPFFDVTNEGGGSTVYIGVIGEDETSSALGTAVLGKMVLA